MFFNILLRRIRLCSIFKSVFKQNLNDFLKSVINVSKEIENVDIL